jgi:hypothetical protein
LQNTTVVFRKVREVKMDNKQILDFQHYLATGKALKACPVCGGRLKGQVIFDPTDPNGGGVVDIWCPRCDFFDCLEFEEAVEEVGPPDKKRRKGP